MKETTAKINKTKSQFFEKINKIDKPLTRLIKQKSQKTQIKSSSNQKLEDSNHCRNAKDHER